MAILPELLLDDEVLLLEDELLDDKELLEELLLEELLLEELLDELEEEPDTGSLVDPPPQASKTLAQNTVNKERENARRNKESDENTAGTP